jgi:hypothetical protein
MPAATVQDYNVLTNHAQQRMTARSLSHEAIFAAMTFGRSIHTRGADIQVIGRKEVQQYRQHGINLAPFEGVQLVCAPDGAVLTVYRNRDFRRLRPRSRLRRRQAKMLRQLHDLV